MLHVEDEEEENTDSLEADDGSGDGGGHDPQKSSRDECMDRLKSEMDLGGEAMAALVAQRLDLEAAMRAVQGLEHRLRNLTTSGPDSTDGALTPITLRKLQEEHSFITWVPFLQRAFQIIKHALSWRSGRLGWSGLLHFVPKKKHLKQRPRA